MKKFPAVCLLIMVCVWSGFSQTLDEPRLIDSWQNANAEELEFRLDAFANALDEYPNSTAWIVTSRNKDLPIGFPVRYAARIRMYLLQNRKIDPARLRFAHCGLGDGTLASLTLYPPDYQENSLQNLMCLEPGLLPGTKEPFLFDKFWYQMPEENSTCCVTDNYGALEKNASLDAFAEKLKADEKQRAVLIFYSYKCVKTETCKTRPSDSAKLAGQVLQREKKYLIAQHKIAASRIITLDGGFNRGESSEAARRIEFWLVGQGGAIPKPTPDYTPRKKK